MCSIRHIVREGQTLTGGVEAALTIKEPFLENPIGDWCDLAPKLCLAASAEKVRDDEDTRACAAMPFFPPLLPLMQQQKRVFFF